jgi:sulfate adenylyltransferase
MPDAVRQDETSLIVPHGGRLVDLFADAPRAADVRTRSREWPSWTLTPRQQCDLELLMNGGFSPLTGFMGRADYESVCSSMRLADGTLWPIPITLDVPAAFAATVRPGLSVALRDPEHVMLAALHVEEVWEPDRCAEAAAVFRTVDPSHPGVAAILGPQAQWIVAGRIEGIQPPIHYDFRSLRLTPRELRAAFCRLEWRRVVAFQTRNPMHRAHRELTLRAAEASDAHLLIHPSVGVTMPGDVDHFTRVRCYEKMLATYPPGRAMLSLLPLAMRMGGPREAIWHAIIRKNHGCTHLIVGRDHAGPGPGAGGRPFYGPDEAQTLLREHEQELGVTMVPFREMAYLPDLDRYVPEDEVPAGAAALRVSGTELRRRLVAGESLPDWFTIREVAEELQRTHPPRQRQGCAVFFTGLSGAGKSTIANVLLVKLLERGRRRVTLLDGDLVRAHLSSELDFSKAGRDLNVRRVGYVAAEIVKHGGMAICAPIAPYDATRKAVRQMVEAHGGFLLVYVSTPLDVCEARDRKGLYSKARANLIPNFTGVSDPYEAPEDADVVIDASMTSPEDAADAVLAYLEASGFATGEAADRRLPAD